MRSVVTHPIQYQAPLLWRIAEDPNIDLTVFYGSDVSTKEFRDAGFDRVTTWDVPLLNGYRYEFLPAIERTDRLSFWRPFNYGLRKRLQAGRFDALWVLGYARWTHWVAMIVAKTQVAHVMVRDEAKGRSGDDLAELKAALRSLDPKWRGSQVSL